MADVYGATVSKDTISKITDKVLKKVAEWRDRPLDKVYSVMFIEAIVRHEAALGPSGGERPNTDAVPHKAEPSQLYRSADGRMHTQHHADHLQGPAGWPSTGCR